MKQSAKIHAEFGALQQRINALYAEVDRCQPIDLPPPESDVWIRSAAGQVEANRQRENQRRRERVDQIAAELSKLNDDAARLRKAYAEAVTAERNQPSLPPVSAEMLELLDKRGALADQLLELQASRVRHALAAAGGDKDAQTALDRARRDGELIWSRMQDMDIARTLLEAREAEQRREFQERTADSRFSAARRLAEEVAAHDHQTDLMMRALAEHLAKRAALLTEIRKTGCSLDSARINMLSTVEVLHRAAKHAGLAEFLGISVVHHAAGPLEDVSRKLLKLAIKRPNPKEEAA